MRGICFHCEQRKPGNTNDYRPFCSQRCAAVWAREYTNEHFSDDEIWEILQRRRDDREDYGAERWEPVDTRPDVERYR